MAYVIKLKRSTGAMTLKHIRRNVQVKHVGRQGADGTPGLGIPENGVTGQILRKASDADYDTEWATAAGTGDMLAATYDPQNISDDAFNVDNHTDGTTNKVYTAVEETKLAGIATGATANSTDAQLRARASHTGTQTASTISDFDTGVSNNTDVAANTTARHSHSNKAQLDLVTDGDHDVRTDNPHGVTKTQVGLGNVDNTSDATKNAASVTLTNKTISADSNTISNIDTTEIKASALVTEAEGLNSSDNDTSWPTTAAVKDYVDDSVAGSGGVVDSVVAGDNIDVDSTDPANPVVSVESLTVADVSGAAVDADVVHDTGTETIAGVKTFSSDPIIPDEVYGAGWNGSLEPPTKNALYDKIETMGGGGGGTVDTVVAGTNIDVDATDPANPIVSVETLTLADVSDVTASAAEVNILDGVTADATELNTLDGITATVTELNYTDGVTSPLQTQMGGKASTALGNLASVAINTTLLPASNDGAALGSGTLGFSDLFLATGGVLNWNNGTVTLAQSSNRIDFTTAGTVFRLSSTGELQFSSDTAITRASAGVIAVGGLAVVTTSGTATLSNKTLTSPVINTGVSGTAIDTDGTLAANSDTLLPSQKAVKTYADTKQPLDTDLTTIAGLTATTDNFMVATASAWASRTPSQARTQMGLGALATLATVGTSQIDDAAVTLAKMANLAQDQFIGRTTASTGVPETATITAAARTVLDDTTVGAMVDTIGGASATGTGGLVRKTSPALVTPDLGTPSAVTLTNATGLPVAGITSSTSTALGVGSLELGHASDTTITRSAAGRTAVEGINVVLVSSTDTLTNKRITKRTSNEASSATPTINTDNVDMHLITALAANITSMTTNLSGTPTEGQALWIAITGTATRTIAWGASFESSTIVLPTTTAGTNRLDIGFVWNTVTTKWRCIAAG